MDLSYKFINQRIAIWDKSKIWEDFLGIDKETQNWDEKILNFEFELIIFSTLRWEYKFEMRNFSNSTLRKFPWKQNIGGEKFLKFELWKFREYGPSTSACTAETILFFKFKTCDLEVLSLDYEKVQLLTNNTKPHVG